MPEDKMIHELPVAPRISSSDLFETEIPDTLSETGYKSGHHSLSVIENQVLGTEQYNSQLPNFPQGSRSVFSALEYARQSGGGGGASVVQKTLAEYQVLPTSDKMNGSIYKITDKALIYCLDEEYHALKEIASADYALLSSDEKNNGTLYVITDEETTAADIPYSAGVSVADAINGVIAKTNVDKSFNAVANGFSDTGSRILVFVPFPFLMADTNYNVDCDYVNLVGQGIYTTGITVDSKYESGCMLIVTATATSGRAYGGRVYIRVYTS